ncbi:MAG TPA: LytR C-terminal domain-containing protein, partial [Mycobacterium sp.]|nr:LytR C-terminal domain-containing protein [Mycobacterium sp.]
GWNVMDIVKQLQKLAAGRVAFTTIPVLDESGSSDDGMQSVVRVDPAQLQAFVKGLLTDQAQGKTQQLAYTPSKTTADVLNDSDIGGLAAAVSAVLTGNGFTAGAVGNNVDGHVSGSQVQAANGDDPGAQAVAKQLGGLPIVANPTVAPGSVRVVLAADYTDPGSGLEGARLAPSEVASDPDAPPPSPILTAGGDKAECVN